MEVYIEKEGKGTNLTFRGPVKDLLKKLNLVSSACIAVKDGKVITNDTLIKNKDKIKILSTVSGG